jgi:transposase
MLRDATCFKKIILVCGRTDMRKGINGLAAVAQLQYRQSPVEEGTLFLFCGRSRTVLKGLCYEGDGFLLLTKRLVDGVYQWPRNSKEAMALSQEQFQRLMNGFTGESSIRIPASDPTQKVS